MRHTVPAPLPPGHPLPRAVSQGLTLFTAPSPTRFICLTSVLSCSQDSHGEQLLIGPILKWPWGQRVGSSVERRGEMKSRSRQRVEEGVHEGHGQQQSHHRGHVPGRGPLPALLGPRLHGAGFCELLKQRVKQGVGTVCLISGRTEGDTAPCASSAGHPNQSP